MKHITSVLLAIVISLSGLPSFLVEDASRDGAIDLRDAILQIQDFTGTADRTASFSFGFEKMVNTLSSVAGLKTLVDPNKESKSNKHQTNLVIAPDKIFDAYSIHPPPVMTHRAEYSEFFVFYESRPLDPSIPPPRPA